ncbi:hypothetical protein SDC9_129694 [bioreactor metagenome]|uniref:Uncharacterized protein n=1 Tax=bioreactor metagenome TaxID=1076179 RepID=A0A645D1N4_9ZZZZ
MKIVRQEAQTDPGRGGGDQTGRGRHHEVLFAGEHIGVGEHRGRTDGDHSGGQPVQPVHHVDRVHADEDEDHRDDDRGRLIERDDLVRQRNPIHPHTEEHRDTCGEHLAGGLGDRRQIDDVVDHAHQADHRPGRQDAERVAGDDLVAPEERHHRPQQEGHRHPAEHRNTTEIGRRPGVHVTDPDLRLNAESDGDGAAQPRQQVGRCCRGEHHQQVFTHPASARRRTPPQDRIRGPLG